MSSNYPEVGMPSHLNTVELFQQFAKSIQGGITRTIAQKTLDEHKRDQEYAARVSERYLRQVKKSSDKKTEKSIKQIMIGRLQERRSNIITALLIEQDDTTLTEKVDLFSDQLQSLKTIGEYAFNQLKNEGWFDGRTIDYNRHILALFVMYLVKNSQAQSLTLVTGDMDGLKKLNQINPQLGDLGLLTVFGASRALASHYDGINFAPNKEGGDDTLAIFVDLPPEKANSLHAELDAILKTITTSQHDIFNVWEQDSIYLNGQKSIDLSFHSTGEQKSLTNEQADRYRVEHANKALSPGLTHLTYTIQLDDLRKIWGKTGNTKDVLNVFFDEWNQKHTIIDKAKAKIKNEQQSAQPPPHKSSS